MNIVEDVVRISQAMKYLEKVGAFVRAHGFDARVKFGHVEWTVPYGDNIYTASSLLEAREKLGY